MMADRKENEKVDRRSSKRKRQVAQGLRKVDSETRKQVAAARLDALENDNMVEQVDEDSDDYVVSSDEDEEEPAFRQPGKKGLSKPGVKKRKTRHANSHTRTKTKPFQTLLEEADLESMPVGSFNYLTAAAAPPPKAYRLGSSAPSAASFRRTLAHDAEPVSVAKSVTMCIVKLDV
eukprot:CAMPEP_0114304410 /NCGR_PEP_ID=MMETSP0059-20121206/15772_1 /TAXON_ID=36894 /ORGANISM="Pyramimonas parkeae, Strain CCMP726" /LENGTH=175 /DNA_ID=CAMNT_0001427507 /DNA_START=1 /DNA_END=529 /DNA_ORIENTATION=+